MTESNVNDRRFWMVVAELNNGDFAPIANIYHELDGLEEFMMDSEKADTIAKQAATKPEYKNVYVLEAVSRYSVPAPKVIKQNLHIPPLQARDTEEKPNE